MIQRILKAKKEDMPKVAQFIRSSARWYKKFVDPKDMDEHHVGRKWIEENFNRRDFYIAQTNKKEEVGAISTQFFGDTAYLGYIYLDTDHVGKGYGQALIDHAKDLCEAKSNVDNMVLIAHPKATWATRAYEKYGFKKILTKKKDILNFKNGLLKPYYEEGFHLYQYQL